jgi:Large polyvalent protein associated domain 22/Histidine kinase-, DNA gyrase B-, and HSP90-like ATPase
MPSAEEWANIIGEGQAKEAQSTLLGDLMSPDVAAKTLANSAQRGIPFALNTADPEDFNHESMINRAQNVAADDPIIQRYLNNNDFAAHVSHDDLDNLSLLGRAVKKMAGVGESFGTGVNRGLASNADSLAQAITDSPLTPEQKARIVAEQTRPKSEGFNWVAENLGEMIGGITEAGVKGGTLGMVAAGGAAVVGGGLAALALPEVALGMGGAFLAGTAIKMGMDAASSGWEQLQALEESKGIKIPAYAKQAAALAIGATTYYGMKLGAGPAITQFGKEVILKAAENPTTARALAKVVQTTAESGAMVGALGMAQTGINTVAQDLAQTIASPEFETIFNDPQKRQELKDNLVNSFYAAALAGGMLHLPFAGASYLGDRALIKQSRADQKNYADMMAAAAKAKTLESPEAFRAFMDEAAVAAGKEGREFGIPANSLIQAFGEGVLEKFDFIPGFEEKLKAAYERGGDVSIPLKDWILAVKEDPELAQALKDDIRPRPESLTKREADALSEAKPEHYEPKPAETVMHSGITDHLREIQPEAFERPAKPVEDLKPQAQDIKAKPGVDVGRMAKLLSQQLYGDPSETATVSLKEMFQNSFDAIKTLLDKGSMHKGAIDIKMDKPKRTITITDNGSGMHADILSTKFLQIGGTHAKEGGRSSGGLGIAKMQFLFSNNRLKVETLHNGVLSVLETTGKELHDALTDPDKSPTIKTSAPDALTRKVFPDGHGTRVTIEVPDHYEHASTGELRPVYFDDWEYNHKVLAHSPLFRNIQVTFNGRPLQGIGDTFPHENYTPLITAQFSWGKAKIYVSKDATSTHRNMHVLSNGLWQFSGQLKQDPRGYDPIKREFYVDVEPSVRADQPGYPFELSRQGFSRVVQDDFQKIQNYISLMFQRQDLAESSQNFGHIQYVHAPEGKLEVTPKEVLQPDIPPRESAIDRIKEGDKVEVTEQGDLLVNGKLIPPLDPAELSKTKIDSDELTIPQERIDPNRVMLHDNTLFIPKEEGPPEPTYPADPFRQEPYKEPFEEEPYSDLKDHVSIVDYAREKFGHRFDEFVYLTGTAFQTLRDEVARIMGYHDLLKEGIGISFDTTYRGVSIRLPFSGSFLNIAVPEYTDVKRASAGLILTMVHELAHHKVRSHDAEFPAEMQRILNNLETDEDFDFQGFKHVFSMVIAENHDILLNLNGIYNDPGSNLRSRGKRLKDTSEGRAGDAGGARDVTGAREGAGGDTGLLKPMREGIDDAKPVEGPEPVSREHEIEQQYNEAGKLAKKELWLHAIFKDNKALNLLKGEFAKYSKKLQAVNAEANKRGAAAAAREVAQRQTKEWKDNERQVRSETALDLSYRPELMADNFFRSGQYPGVRKIQRFKLNEDLIKERYGEEGLDALDPQTVSKTGLDPDEAAGFFGFNSGEALVRGLQKVKRDRGDLKPKEYFDSLVEEETQQRMEHQYGVLSKNILEEVRELEGTSGQADLLADELHYLQTLETHPKGLAEGETLPAKAITKEMIADHARRALDRAFWGNILNTDAIARDVGRAGRQAELAHFNGKTKDALQAKQRQAISLAILQAAKDFVNKVYNPTQKRIERFSKNEVVKGVSQEYTDQAHNLLSMVKANIPRTEENLGEALEGRTLDAFVSAKGADGWAVPPPNLPRGKALKDFTTEEYRDFAATLNGLEVMGRREGQIIIRDKLIEFEEAVAKAMDNLSTLKGTFDPRKMKGFRAAGRTFDASMIKAEQLFDWMDKNDPSGIFNTVVFRPLSEAEHWKLDKLQRELAPAMRALPRRSWRELREQIDNQTLMDPKTTQPMRLNRENLLKMALYWGTETGQKKLLGSLGLKEDSAASMEAFFKQHLNEKDHEFLNGMWKALSILGPDIKRVTKDMTGVSIDLLDPVPFESQHGTLTGGYVPLTEDAYERIQRGKIKPEEDLFSGRAFQMLPTTQAVKRRTGKMYPLSLELGDISQVLVDTVHYLAFAEPMRDARKFLNDERVRRGISEAFGPEYTKHLDPWLDFISTNGGLTDDKALHWLWKASRFARQNAQFMALGFNEITPQLHGGSAAMNSFQEVGLRNIGSFAKAAFASVPRAALESTVRRMTRSPKNMDLIIAEAFEDSGEIRNRKLKLDDNMQAMYQLALGKKWSTMRASFHQFGMSAIGFLDQWSAIATWKAVKDDALKRGFSKEDAIYMGDKAVRNAHGASGLTDLAAIQRGPEPFKWATMFMTYFIHNYNRNRDTARIAEGKTDLDSWGRWGTVAARSMMYVVFPAMWHHYLRGQPKKDESVGDDIAEGLISQLGSSVPYLRDMIYAYQSRRSSKQMINDFMDGLVDPVRDAMHALEGEKISNKWVKHTLEAPGWTLGASSKPIARAGQYLWDIDSGKEREPADFSEWWRGMTTGHTDEPKPR